MSEGCSMTRPEGEEMKGNLVGICVGQKHLVELLNRGIHWLPSSGCSKTHQHHSWPSPPTLLGCPDKEFNPCCAAGGQQAGKEPVHFEAAVLSSGQWVLLLDLNYVIKRKLIMQCAMLRHDRLRCKPNVGSVQEESLFSPLWVCGVGKGVECVCYQHFLCVCIVHHDLCDSLAIRPETPVSSD